MDYILYLDDIRTPTPAFGIWPEDSKYPYMVAKSFDEAVKIVEENGFPLIVDLDHDLGYGKNGTAFAQWLFDDYDRRTNSMPENFKFSVHSANSEGAKDMWSKYNSYIKSKKLP